VRDDPLRDPVDTWGQLAACRGSDLELFYSLDEADQEQALAICRTCPVIAECLDHAMTHREAFGVWGGTRETERRRIFRRERRRRAEERRHRAA